MTATKFGIIGLGKMGSALALRAVDQGFSVAGYATKVKEPEKLLERGIEISPTLKKMIALLPSPRIVFLFITAGAAVDTTLRSLLPILGPGDVILDGGNSHFRDSMSRQSILASYKIGFIDCGTSGGPSGARSGPCFMIGGDPDDVQVVEPILKALAAADGYLHVGPPGAGHFAKLIHNAIEYGMLQSIAEGISLLEHSSFKIDLPAVLKNWSHGSVIRGWLIELMQRATLENPNWEKISPYVEDTGEVNWIVEEAVRQEIRIPAIAASVFELFSSRDMDETAIKSVSLLRHAFGGHPFGENAEVAEARRNGRGAIEILKEVLHKKAA